MAVWKKSKTSKSNTINRQHFFTVNLLASFRGCFPKALQNQTVVRNLRAPFDLIFCTFQYGNRVAKPFVPYSKVKAFRCFFTENDNMMSCVRQMLFGRNMQIYVILFKVYLDTYYSNVVCAA